LYALAIMTGMRQGELLGLRWREVDLDRGWLAVRYALRQGTRELAEPKTERARRTLRLGSTRCQSSASSVGDKGRSTLTPSSWLLGLGDH
jgi:integrase